jgi:hypothetical protein
MNLVEADTFVSLACDEALAHNSCEPVFRICSSVWLSLVQQLLCGKTLRYLPIFPRDHDVAFPQEPWEICWCNAGKIVGRVSGDLQYTHSILKSRADSRANPM